VDVDYLPPVDLLGLTAKQLRDYRARLERYKTHRLPWEPHTSRLQFWVAMGDLERELRRRGTQLRLID
jgi:hypothetical protein